MSDTRTQHGTPAGAWNADSWRARTGEQLIVYPDERMLRQAVDTLRSLPPLVTSWEIETLKVHIAEAQEGKRFLLQGGDCAELLDECEPARITNKLKILLQMSLVLVHGSKKPVIRVGRFAGQYAKPRSAPMESGALDDGTRAELPSYFGDLVNRSEFSHEARQANPRLLLEGYKHAAMTLNFIRALTAGGFADLHHPEYWDLSFFEHVDLPEHMRKRYEESTARLAEALRFMEAIGERSVDELTRVEFFTSHEGLNLEYESAQTRTVPRRTGVYDLSTHLPWIGERTRRIDGAHVEFFRGIANPVGVKLGPGVDPQDAIALARTLNPHNEAGKLLFVVRMGVENVRDKLPALIESVNNAGVRVLWVCDPMHGNTTTTSTGLKTRNFDDIIEEIERSFDAHEEAGTILGGVHFELTGEDVTECVGGASGVTESDLDRAYQSRCDPRLNYAQSLELALRIAARMHESA
ncbi:MAG: 3-deoxy-7-phosphoheptulonate synthase class II [Planctomycetota bacterium]|jgi:3-deoxy-7-phosphoheptulonate synthase